MDFIRPEWGVYLTTIIWTSKKGIRTAAELQEHGFAGSAAQQAYPEGLQALLLPSEGLRSNFESLLVPSEPCWQPVRKQALKVPEQATLITQNVLVPGGSYYFC